MDVVNCANCGDTTDEAYNLGSHMPGYYCPKCKNQIRWREWYEIKFEKWGWL